MAMELGIMPSDEALAVVKLFDSLKLSLNKQREILTFIREISLRETLSILDLLEDNRLKEILNDRMSSGIRASLKSNKNGRSWESIVGYTLDSLIKRLKATIPDGYTWNDYMNGAKLHIDHIVPISVHNFKSYKDTDFKRCWSLKNLQLLPAKDNIAKSNKLVKPFQMSLEGI